MTDQQPEQASPTLSFNESMRRFRENVAAAIALVIVLGAVGLILLALSQLEGPDSFTRAKDLLLVLNPLLGVVLGYYFNKVSTESRAESAEMTARSVAATAQQATEARSQAESQARAAQQEAQEAVGTLKDMSAAAGKMLEQWPSGAPGVLGAGAAPSDDLRQELRDAWLRSRRYFGK